jgi:hypothetical protein
MNAEELLIQNFLSMLYQLGKNESIVVLHLIKLLFREKESYKNVEVSTCNIISF